MNKKSARLTLALLKSAEAAAKEKDYKAEDLIICEALVNEGRKLKRYFIRARGRSTKYMKRYSHLKISVCGKAEEKQAKKEVKKEEQRKNNGKKS